MEQDALERIAVEQFTVHAAAFAASPVITDTEALDSLVRLAAVGPADVVADVACGPGIVSERLAALARFVVGVDLTPAMLALASARCSGAGLCGFLLGRMTAVPAPDRAFSRVVSRYALHHAADPEAAAAELARICAPRGRLVIADFAATEDVVAARAYDEAERLRDPSHVRNLTRSELGAVLEGAGFTVVDEGSYRLEADLDRVLANSHGTDHAGVRAAFEASIGGHGLGVGARRVGDGIRFAYPIAVLAAERTR